MSVTSHPPGPKARSPLGHLSRFRRDPLGFLSRLAADHGDVVGFRVGPQRLVLLRDPEHIRDVLVTSNRNFVKSRQLVFTKRVLGEGLLTSEGEFHRRQRRLASPAFHRQRIMAYATVMVDHSLRITERWSDGKEIDVHDEMMRLTLGVVAETLFGANVEKESHEIGEALAIVMGMFARVTNPLAELLEKLPLPSNRRFFEARGRLDTTVYRIIEERRRSGEDRGDLLSMLLAARDVEGDGSGMNDLQLRDEAMTLFLAGHETTANALSWTWLLLSRNPEAERRLHAELDEVLDDRAPTYDDLPRLVYTERVLAESMRIYPPAWVISRRALEDHRLGDWRIPAGTTLMMSQWVSHRDERWFPEPERFDPDRWTPELREARPKFSYFPFGGGPRVCIGESFAWMEGILLLATIARRWRFRPVPDHPIEFLPLVTLRPKHGMRAVPERR